MRLDADLVAVECGGGWSVRSSQIREWEHAASVPVQQVRVSDRLVCRRSFPPLRWAGEEDDEAGEYKGSLRLTSIVLLRGFFLCVCVSFFVKIPALRGRISFSRERAITECNAVFRFESKTKKGDRCPEVWLCHPSSAVWCLCVLFCFYLSVWQREQGTINNSRRFNKATDKITSFAFTIIFLKVGRAPVCPLFTF